MSVETDPGRWWENYLVRYFMPSIAGIGIVAWLIYVEPALRPILFFGNSGSTLDAPTLTLLILYGNLFCYVASFPILCFHVTRALDFKEHRWLHNLDDGYVFSAIVSVLIVISTVELEGKSSQVVVFVSTAAYGLVQLIRFWRVFSRSTIPLEHEGRSARSRAYAYAFFLARRRNVHLTMPSKDKGASTHGIPSTATDPTRLLSGPTKSVEMRWRKEFTDTYRHMREHGNSAFIFVLEFTLAAASICILRNWPNNEAQGLSVLGGFLVVWSAPSIGVHLLAQSLEHRFSLIDEEFPAKKG